LEWDLKQGIERMNVKCYVTLANTTHIGECVLIFRMHQTKDGGKTCGDFQIQ